MFGFRKSVVPATIQWPSVLSLLQDDDRRAPLVRSYPNEGRESFLGALQRIDASVAATVMSAGKQLHWAAEVVNYPTVAIAGMLNSGKTSLVATFLSEQGKKRTLRGTGNHEGTHRFVLWLPERWRAEQECFSMLIARIGEALGTVPEMLSNDPAEAHQQYNNAKRDSAAASIPLIATDPGLDHAGIGLLDCPDVVSDAAFGLGSPEQRRVLLGKCAMLCSAFMVVASAEQARDATLSDLLRIASEQMPGVPRFLAVNKVRAKNQTPVQVLETFQPLVARYGIASLYAAYDFEVESSRPYIPFQAQTTTAHPVLPGEDLPIFFSVHPSQAENPPAQISAERLLVSLPSQLDRSKLSEQFQRALELGLEKAVWHQGYRLIQQHTHQAQQASRRIREDLLSAALEFFAVRDPGGMIQELRLHQSERILRQLSESFAATAPWYARWNVRIHSTIKKIFGGAGDFVRQLLPTAQMHSAAERIKNDMKSGKVGGLITTERLQHAIAAHTASAPWKTDDAWVDDACETALDRYERDDFTTLDPRSLDAACREMWTQLGAIDKVKAGLTPLAMLLATVGGVMMIPVDFGHSVIASASIAELLGAAGIAALAAQWAGRHSIESVGQQAAKQQLSDFHAVLCDVFGLARDSAGLSISIKGNKTMLPKPTIASKPAIGPATPDYRLQPGFESELQQLLPRP